ncbi:pyridoxal phosphate-dependent aminotransferase [Methylophaga lonarensis]|uniref:pyridoxal phosphate-dependent aminotransferase n=1 Tax=Methylophaga lonarensis TaxID=999151 RepID=UPI003D29292F
MLEPAHRAAEIEPFRVMSLLAEARQMETEGRDIVHMEVGEPDFITPAPIIQAGIEALQAGHTHYTAATGLPQLRQAIADWYQHYYQLDIAASRIIVTPGASGALLLAFGALLERDRHVMLADPGYPCNRHFARFIEGRVNAVNVDAASNFQLDAALVAKHWNQETDLLLLASPSNPTGTVLEQAQLAQIAEQVRLQGGQLIVDEIYHGLTYDGFVAPTALSVDDEAIVINSFSKFFGMTGWRLGWLVVPERLVAVMDKLAQNLFLAAPTLAQYAALAAFEPETQQILEQRRQAFEQRRDRLMPGLKKLGFKIDSTPRGAFYIYADCSALLDKETPDSMRLCQRLLHEAGVAITPGLDFGQHRAAHYCRFAYTNELNRLDEAVKRIADWLQRR